MNSSVSLVLKVLVLSAGLAIAIKYGATHLPIPTNPANAVVLAIVLLPSLVMAALLVRMQAKPDR